MSSSSSLPPLFDEFPPVSTEEWREQIKQDLGNASDDVLLWESLDGVELPAVLRHENLEDVRHVSSEASVPPLAVPDSSAPNSWRIRQDVQPRTPEQANRTIREAVDSGLTNIGLTTGFSASSETERPAIETLDDLRTVLEKVPLSRVTFHFDRGPCAVLLIHGLQVIANERDLPHKWRASVGYDPTAALALGTLQQPDRAYNVATSLLENTGSTTNRRTVSIDLRPYHDAGASVVQELAYGLGALCELLSQTLDDGPSLADTLPHLQFLTAVSTSYFVEIAKLRALRLLVPQVIDAFAAKTDPSIDISPSDLFVQVQTSRRTETTYDPHMNMLRGTTEAMAAVLGGCDILSVRPYDAAFRSSDEFGRRISRNVQRILQHEAHFESVSDPAAGAYYVEAATDQLAERAWTAFQELEANGGLLDALQSGRIQNQIADVRERRMASVENQDRILVGTNHYPDLEETRLQDLDPVVFSPNHGRVGGNSFLESLPSRQGNKEVVSDLRQALDTASREIEPLPEVRVASPIEKVRLRTEIHAEKTGNTPTVFLLPIGPTGPRSARANFARHVFGVAGFDVLEHLQFEALTEAAASAAESIPDILVLCSADAEYPDLTPRLRATLEAHDLSPLLVVAGNPDQLSDSIRADDFIYKNMPLRKKLEAVQDRLGLRVPATGSVN